MAEQKERTAEDVVDGLSPKPVGPAPKEPFAPTTPGTAEGPDDDDDHRALARKPHQHGAGGFPEAGSIQPGVGDVQESDR